MVQARAVLIGVARPGFDVELATKRYEEFVKLLRAMGAEVLHPGAPVVEPEQAAAAARQLAQGSAHALIVQFSTFVDGRFIAGIAGASDLPVLLWGLPEPADHGRLRLNSLTGLNAAGYVLGRLGRKYCFVYGPPAKRAAAEIQSWLKAAVLVRDLRSAKIGVVGEPPAGFFASAVDPLELERRLGPAVVRLDLEALFQKAREVPADSVRAALADEAGRVAGLDRLDPQQVDRSTRFEVVLRDQARSLGLSAVAVRCWPEFIAAYQAAACSTLGHLNDAGVPAACEADVLGAVSMLMQQRLSGQVTFLGDMVHVNEERNSATFWHCGAGAPSLASPKSGATAGVQPNRNVGYAFDHRLKAGAVTICRLGQTDGGFRMFLASAQALDDLEHFRGTSVEVRFQRPVRELLELIIGGGFEFHFSIVWADVAAELKHVGALLDIPLTVF